MSIYQNDYFIVPRKGNYTLLEGLSLKTFLENEDLFEDDLFWDKLNYKLDDLYTYLKNVFEIGKSWSNQLKIFGDNETNCLKILVEDDFVVSISFRINFNTNYSSFLKETIEFCKINDFMVVDNELNILSLDFDAIHHNVINSKAYKRAR